MFILKLFYSAEPTFKSDYEPQISIAITGDALKYLQVERGYYMEPDKVSCYFASSCSLSTKASRFSENSLCRLMLM